MQAVVKTPHIEIYITGDIPAKLLSVLQEEYGEKMQLSVDSDDETVDIFDNLRIYRQNHGWTQAQLGEMLGDVPRQHISNMERGHRAISIKIARKLAEIFNVSTEKFV